MKLFRRAIARLGQNGDAIEAQLKQRQDEPSQSVTSSTSASPAARPSDNASATSNSTGTPTSSISASSAGVSSTPSPTESKDHVTDYITDHAFTATKTTAYDAHGVNATHIEHNSTSTYTALDYLATANATAPGVPHNELTACQINGTEADNGPFCSPKHLQNLWVGFTYAITWNPSLFPDHNTSNLVSLTYTDGDRREVWNSSMFTNGQGYANINMQEAWLNGQPGNDSRSGQNMTLHLISDPDSSNSSTKDGPTISLVVDPATLPLVRIHNIPAKYGLEIGLPVGLVAALIIVLALWCGCRKHDRAWRDLKGHGKDYMARRSRRRGRAEKGGGIQLENYNPARGQDAFTDEPYTGGSGNAFRDEVARQREEDDRYRPTVHSY